MRGAKVSTERDESLVTLSLGVRYILVATPLLVKMMTAVTGRNNQILGVCDKFCKLYVI